MTGKPELDLLHSRYTFGDRETRREEVPLRGSASRRDPEVSGALSRAALVSTQIIEQSLDLDFDLMVSDMAPCRSSAAETGQAPPSRTPQADWPGGAQVYRRLSSGYA